MLFNQNISILGFILITVSFFFGIKLPDFDFKLKLRHRSIITHSPLFTILLIALYEVKRDFFFKYFIVGFSVAIAVHMLFDLFPYKWHGGALLKIPINNITCSKETTKLFFIFTILINSFISIFYIETIEEFVFVIILSILVFIKKSKYEKSVVRPIFIFAFLMIGLGILKYDFLMNLTLNLLKNIIKK